MNPWTLLPLAALSMLAPSLPAQSPTPSAPPFTLVIHGGAGTIRRADLTPELETQYRTGLRAALDAGYAILERGGASVDAVIAAIRLLEDNPLFNAGRGAVLDSEGVCELDASLMDGRNLAAGAAAGVRHVKNPILLARAVMERSPHVLLTGAGAEAFAREQKLELAPDEYFITDRRRQELAHAQELERQGRPPEMERATPPPAPAAVASPFPQGTVGAVALDQHGHLAAGTSTGGMTNKRFGRVGDSPIIGAGNYANDATCAVSATGHGEYFIRAVVAHNVSALLEYRGETLARAAGEAIAKVGKLGGTGGLIAVDKTGQVAMPFNTPGMYRAFRQSGGEPGVAIFGPAEEK